MYKGRGSLKPTFVAKNEKFVEIAYQQESYVNGRQLRCPWTKCGCTRIYDVQTVKVHLYKHGFMPNIIWTNHSEAIENISHNVDDASGIGIHWLKGYTLTEELLKEATQWFYNLLVESNEPLFEGSSMYKLSICIRILASKLNWNVPNEYVDFLTKVLLDITLVNKVLAKSYYNSKQLVSKLGLIARRIVLHVDKCTKSYKSYSGWVQISYPTRANVV